MQNHTKSQAPC